MCRSSRILGFLIAWAALATLSGAVHARGFGFAGPRFGGIRIGARFGLGPRFGLRPGRNPGFRGRFGRFGRGYGGFGGFGLGGYGVSSFDLGGGASPPDAPAPAYGRLDSYPQPVVVPVAQRSPACPLIISVGAGLRHPARTRIVYGHQPACR